MLFSTHLVAPYGIAPSPDEKEAGIVEWEGTPNCSIWSYNVGDHG